MTRPEAHRGQLNRRHVIGGVAAAGVGATVLAGCGSDEGNGDSAGDEAAGDDSGSDETTDAPSGISAADVPEGGGIILEDQEAVVTQPSAGEFVAFSSICTHQGCPVAEVTDTINCNCHGSKFSLSDGSVVDGPASSPLPTKSVSVDGDTLTVG